MTLFTGPCNCRDLTCLGVVFSNQMVLGIGDDDVVAEVDAEVLGPLKSGWMSPGRMRVRMRPERSTTRRALPARSKI